MPSISVQARLVAVFEHWQVHSVLNYEIPFGILGTVSRLEVAAPIRPIETHDRRGS